VFKIADAQKTYAMVLGVVLALVGVLGFFNEMVLGYFGVNTLQSVIHLVGGVLLLWMAGRTANLWLGWLGLIVAVLGFVAPAFMASLLNINMAITYLHLAIGVVSLGVAYGAN